MPTVRGFIGEAFRACIKKNLRVRVVSFDGQFLDIVTSNGDGRPLTVLRFAKNFWQHVQRLSRSEKLQQILGADKPIGSPANITRVLTKKISQGTGKGDENNVVDVITTEDPGNYILQYLPYQLQAAWMMML